MLFQKSKIFCIGRNKTGTTSLEAALTSLGIKVGDWAKAEMLMEDWARRDFRSIIKFSRTAQAFRDVPYSLPFTYQALDAAYPGSKFILTIRDSAQQWYESIVRYHTKIVGKGRRPTPDDLRAFSYRFKGFLWRQQELVYGADEKRVYDRDLYTRQYELHNRDVLEYFRFRKQDLLVLNVRDAAAMQQLCRFLNVKYAGQQMPHKNRSDG